MAKRFNITGTCFPDRHYMVDIRDRVAQIKRMVDDNEYFCINRGRQYGKTTTLYQAAETLSKDYTVLSISFEGMSEAQFESIESLGYAFLCERFIVHFKDIYGDRDAKFVENEGRKYFMFYVKPIINGVGNYYIESRTRDNLRTDMIIDYLGHQYIIEMKIWRGESYNRRGEAQLSEYLDYYHLEKGYLVSFCFNKNKTSGVRTVLVGNRKIIEGVV